MGATKDTIKFVNRKQEVQELELISKTIAPKIVIVYGRRRVGKTELIEKVFGERQLMKFEGLEGLDDQAQRKEFLRQLITLSRDLSLLTATTSSWTEVFELLTPHLKASKITLYFEELQWLANYKQDFVSAIKYFWDNHWRHLKGFVLVLCGSSPSFMINQVVRSKALYNRTEIEFPVNQFNIAAVREFLGDKASTKEVFEAVLSVGGIPPYLERLSKKRSVYLGLVEQSFKPNSYFLNEYERIFTSSLRKKAGYRQAIEELALVHSYNRKELAAKISIPPGGYLTELLNDLELSGFITSYTPVDKPSASRLKRYSLVDPYIRFYNFAIKPNLKKIQDRTFEDNPALAFPLNRFKQMLGFAFERWVFSNQSKIAKLLGFGAVEYACGAYFRRSEGAQIDLVFERKDGVSTLVEIKYTDEPVGPAVIDECQRKEKVYLKHKKNSIEWILISAFGASSTVTDSGFYREILTLEDLVGL